MSWRLNSYIALLGFLLLIPIDSGANETRSVNAKFWIPSEDEWYKAAYHKNDGVTGNYFDYPTGSDATPSNDLDLGGNNATFYQGGFTISNETAGCLVNTNPNQSEARHQGDVPGNG